jgi:hypothetical protein
MLLLSSQRAPMNERLLQKHFFFILPGNTNGAANLKSQNRSGMMSEHK